MKCFQPIHIALIRMCRSPAVILATIAIYSCLTLKLFAQDPIGASKTSLSNGDHNLIDPRVNRGKEIMLQLDLLNTFDSPDSIELNKLLRLGDSLYNDYHSGPPSTNLAYAHFFRGTEATAYIKDGNFYTTTLYQAERTKFAYTNLSLAYEMFKNTGTQQEECESLYWLIYISNEFGLERNLLNQRLTTLIDTAACKIDSFNLGRAYLYLGINTRIEMQNFNAITYFRYALNFLGEDRNSFGHLLNKEFVFFNMAQIYGELGFNEKARDNLIKSIDLEFQMGDTIGAMWTISTLVGIYQKLNEPEKARESLAQLKRLSKTNKIEDLGLRGELMLDEAMFLFDEKKYSETKQILSKLHDVEQQVIRDSLDISAELHYTFSKMHTVLWELEKIEKGAKQLEYVKKAFQYALNSNNVELVLECSARLRQIYTSLGDHESEQRIALIENEHNSISLDNKLKTHVSKLRFDLNLKKAESRRYELELNKSRKIAKIAKQHTRIVVGLFFLGLASLLGLYFVLKANFNKKKTQQFEKINKQLEKTNREFLMKNDLLQTELKNKIFILTNNNELFKELSREISTYNISSDEKQKILNKINVSSKTDVLTALENQLFELHKDFVKVLSEKHPQLSRKNIKLCILVKLNLSTKEIAQLMFLAPSSLKVARSRLRKKIGLLDSNKKLVTFLNSLDKREHEKA